MKIAIDEGDLAAFLSALKIETGPPRPATATARRCQRSPNGSGGAANTGGRGSACPWLDRSDIGTRGHGPKGSVAAAAARMCPALRKSQEQPDSRNRTQ